MMVSILILTIGLVGTAALMSNSVNMGAHARYVSTAALLASEKMEDLDRFPNNDPNLTAGREPGREHHRLLRLGPDFDGERKHERNDDREWRHHPLHAEA